MNPFGEDSDNSRLARFEGEAVLYPMISQPAGLTTNWVGIIHTSKNLGLYKFDAFGNQGNADQLKAACRRRVTKENQLDGAPGCFIPQVVQVSADAKVYNSDGVAVGEMKDYANNPLSATHENDGNIQFLREVGGEYRLRRNGRNQHGAYLQKHLHGAMAAEDYEAVRAYFQYLDLIYGDDISVTYGPEPKDMELQGNTARTMALVDLLDPTIQTVPTSEDEEEPSVAGLEG